MAALRSNGWGKVAVGAIFGGLSSVVVAFGVWVPDVPTRGEVEQKIERAVEKAPVVVEVEHMEAALGRIEGGQQRMWVAIVGVEERLARLEERVAQLKGRGGRPGGGG